MNVPYELMQDVLIQIPKSQTNEAVQQNKLKIQIYKNE